MLFDFLKPKQPVNCPKCGQPCLKTINRGDRILYVHSMKRGKYKPTKRMGYGFKVITTGGTFEQIPQGHTVMKDDSSGL